MSEVYWSRPKPIFRLWKYRQGVAAYIANRTRNPFGQCLDIVELNWRILVQAYDEGARFQDAGRRILEAGDIMKAGPFRDKARDKIGRPKAIQGQNKSPGRSRGSVLDEAGFRELLSAKT